MQSESLSSSDETLGDSESPSTKSYAEKRKSSKPIMEKRRRARINSSLNELKSILLDALKKDTTRHSKLEKADILEMTVRYLKNVERQRMSVSLSIDPTIVDKYKAGFNECRNEVMRFLSTCEGVTVNVRTRLLSHLANCLQSIQSQPGIFDDSNFDCHNSMPSALLINGHSQQPVQLAVPETGFYPASNGPRIAPASQYHPVFDPKLTVIQPRVSAPIVIKDGILTSSINTVGSSNITLLLPSNDTAFFTAPFSSSSVNISPERPLRKTTSPPDKSPKEPAKVRSKSPSLPSSADKAVGLTELKCEHQPSEKPVKLRKILSNPVQIHATSSKTQNSGPKSDIEPTTNKNTSLGENAAPKADGEPTTNSSELARTERKRKRTSSNCDSGVSLSSPRGRRKSSTDASRDSGCHDNAVSPTTGSSLPEKPSRADILNQTTCSSDVTRRRHDATAMTSKGGNPWRPWSKSDLMSDS